MGTSIKDSDDTHWNTTYEAKNGQVNELVGKIDSPEHCHLWKTSDGDSGVEHRGHCKVCDDEKQADEKSESNSISNFANWLFGR